MKFLAVVTTPSIYHSCSAQKTFWEGNFTGKEAFFLYVNMKNCGRRYVRKHKEVRGSDKYINLKKHKEIRGSDKYITLDISSMFDCLDKMKITSSESKGKLERSGEVLMTSLGFRPKQGRKNTNRHGMP